MHNLYLGTGKNVFKLWIGLGLIGKNELSCIEERCSLQLDDFLPTYLLTMVVLKLLSGALGFLRLS